ncbi:MAG: biopolymer transporter ExbD [Caulobacterales bacterium]|nr:biopolymer transporter ExbD [Caulobacterales bacterium]
MRFRRTRDAVNVLNITPLIDVVFILLVFFMIATNFANYRLIRVETPSETRVVKTSVGAIVIAIAQDGALTYDGAAIAHAELAERVAAIVALDPGRAFLVRPAPGVTLQETIAIHDETRAAGASRVSFSAPEPAGEDA